MPRPSSKALVSSNNPIDFIEETLNSEEWPCYRLSSEELLIEIPGRWCDYRLQFIWQEDLNVLQLFCLMDIRLQAKVKTEIQELLCLINEKLAIGHFEMMPEEGVPTYRYGYLLLNVKNLAIEVVEEMINISIAECEKFYPAFQFVIWGGKSAKEAASVAMLDTVGEA
ncbi:hypothetical protein IM40_05040 [Candidatus Paracaedimonas acanthamoebae]|nr:hypothetical protein IM40_05040 [Candidatus Paracaedimonas acanthamoebae]